ncbi:FAD:protein FMN transferase [Polaribacter sp. OB-PA-B3]
MKNYSLIILLICALCISSCSKEAIKKNYTFKGAVFGTTYKITYLNTDENYLEEIDSLFLKMNNSLSTYISDSEISRVNRDEKNVELDPYFIEVFKKSKRIFKETDGYFDPTVGNLVNAWGFGPKKTKIDLTEAEVEKEMQFVGFDKLQLENTIIKKEIPGIYLDFNSIAKGFGIDVVARFLENKNIKNYLVEIGGEIRTKGFKENDEPWLIKLVDPINTDGSGFKTLNLSNKSMATSGNYRKYRISESGKKFVHTVNPKTGYAHESNLLSASVIADLDCADVDAYATAFMAMGLEKTKDFLSKNTKIKAILLYTNENGNLEEYTNYTYK